MIEILNQEILNKYKEMNKTDEIRNKKSIIGLSPDFFFEITPHLTFEEFYVFVMSFAMYDRTGTVPHELFEMIKDDRALKRELKSWICTQERMYNSWKIQYENSQNWKSKKAQRKEENLEKEKTEELPFMGDDALPFPEIENEKDIKNRILLYIGNSVKEFLKLQNKTFNEAFNIAKNDDEISTLLCDDLSSKIYNETELKELKEFQEYYHENN